jgi:hypothetical protein
MIDNALKYRVDICFCIEFSKSMQKFIDAFNDFFQFGFLNDLKTDFHYREKHIEVLRVRFIGFSYLREDVIESPFFILPGQEEEIEDFLLKFYNFQNVRNSLSTICAIENAIKSKWMKRGERFRHIIVVYSDNKATKKMDFNYLTDCWDGQSYMSNRSAKRLIVFAPDSNAWTDIATHWDNTVHYPSRAGEGLAEVDYQTILSAIVNSI